MAGRRRLPDVAERLDAGDAAVLVQPRGGCLRPEWSTRVDGLRSSASLDGGDVDFLGIPVDARLFAGTGAADGVAVATAIAGAAESGHAGSVALDAGAEDFGGWIGISGFGRGFERLGFLLRRVPPACLRVVARAWAARPSVAAAAGVAVAAG